MPGEAHAVPRYLWNLLIALDVIGNAITGGNPRETISSRIGRYLRHRPAQHWIHRVWLPGWLRRHFLETNDRA
jgi:hypothetical protein